MKSHHRKFYVDGKLEFGLFFDENITDQNTIISEFLATKDWKSFSEYCKVKFSSYKFSKDMLEVFITTKKLEGKPMK